MMAFIPCVEGVTEQIIPCIQLVKSGKELKHSQHGKLSPVILKDRKLVKWLNNFIETEYLVEKQAWRTVIFVSILLWLRITCFYSEPYSGPDEATVVIADYSAD